MLALPSKLKQGGGLRVLDRLLVKEVAEPEANLPCTCKVRFPNLNKFHCFQLEMLVQDLFTERKLSVLNGLGHWLDCHDDTEGCCLGLNCLLIF
uniref:Uncharacterized protein n=1 Tax=Moschus moschiferus TaxID=68415 RepID=A0A8C6DZZ0_MOSMO